MMGSFLGVFATLLIAASDISRDAVVLYVAPGGNDSWSGRAAEPVGPDGPFATLMRARDEVRRLIKTRPVPRGTTVLVRGGTYYLKEPLALGPEDAGTPEAPIVYRAFPGEAVHLVGGKRVSDFVPHEGEILRANLNVAGLAGAKFSQLFFREERQVLARWPNKAEAGMPGGTWTFIAAAVADDRKRSFKYFGDRPSRWKQPEHAQVSIWPNYNWWQTIADIASIDLESKVVHLENELSYTIEPGRRFFYQNVFEELDAPGEWFHDRASNVLYFWPPAAIDSGEVAVPTLDSVVAFEKTAHVALRGFTIECCNGDAVRVADSENCLIGGNIIRNTGSYAVTVSGGKNNRVAGNDIYATGRGGISLQGGDRATLTPAGHRAENNHIHHFGNIYQTYETGVNIGGVGNVIAHNLIHDAPHIGILLGGNEHLIEFNEIHHVCMEGADNGGFYMGRDWTQRGIVIRYNKFHDIYGFGLSNMEENAKGAYEYESPHWGWGVYLDDCTSGITVHGNLFYRVPLCGVMIGGGKDNVVTNNVFVDCIPALHIDARWDTYPYEIMYERLNAMNYSQPPYRTRYPQLLEIGDPAKPTNDRFEHNVISYTYDHFRGLSSTRDVANGAVAYHLDRFDPITTVIDHNLLFHFGLPVRIQYTPYKEKSLGTLSWDDWRAKGFDAHSMIAEPGFKDAERDDYRLRRSSPAFKLGFKTIPVNKIGLYQDDLRATWPAPEDSRRDGVERKVFHVQIPVP
ncbi:MAG: right-handed parallel beta-helix repeat-containing protein [Candidatus Hydrogenedentes bacterium]|nr:right-handed parallel beta-helix repeat-containing protein [Candidatus Hydrogenedentota bacterium]